MFFFSSWDILIVDDEPDVLALSALTMNDFEVYGLPLTLHMAQSKRDATKLLHESPDLATNVAVAFIDVIMESDIAGLQLCETIREEIGNRSTQIFIRTGQPGLAPERTVIDNYEINGYFTKIEATEDKLYSLVKSGVRQFLWSYLAQTYLDGLNEVLAGADWRPRIEKLLNALIDVTPSDMQPDTQQPPLYIAFDRHEMVRRGVTEDDVITWRETLQADRGMRLSVEGSKYVSDGQQRWGIHVVGGHANAEVLLLCETRFVPPDDLILMTHGFLHGLATLWKRKPTLETIGSVA